MQFSFRRLFFKRKRPSILKFLYGMFSLVSLDLSQGEALNSSLEIKILSSEFAFGLKKLFWLLLTATFSEFSDPSREPRPSEQKMTFSIKYFFSECDQIHRTFFVQCKIKVVLVIFSQLIRKCFRLPTTGRFSQSVLVINCFMVGCILRTEIFNPLLK